jgi:uncharacterized protein YdiU (UPF0061 family)
MALPPQAYRPETRLLELGDAFYDPVEAANFPGTILRYRNDRAAAEVALATLSDAEWIAHFGRFQPLPDTLPSPLALRYHGHQFRVYNPEIGDGRGFTFAQLRDAAGRLMDLGTKGSGRTPHSRFGDGRLTLKGGVREILATEMLEALGVDTSRTLSLIETGEALERGDEPSPTRSAVVVRLSHGHIRIGMFQRLAYFRDAENMRRLVDYCLAELFQVEPDADPVGQLLGLTVARTARLAASYMTAGFVHGVLNSDNINVTGESFDYGPWRFAPTWDANFTAAYFDHQGLYAFGRQPEAIHWDCGQLAVSLRAISEAEPLIAALDTFGEHYRAALGELMTRRLGLRRGTAEAEAALVQSIGKTLADTHAPIDRFFFDAFGETLPATYGPEWVEARAHLATFEPIPQRRGHPYFSDPDPCSMLIDEVEAIWAAIDRDDDWSPLHAKVAQVRRMGEALRARTDAGGK